MSCRANTLTADDYADILNRVRDSALSSYQFNFSDEILSVSLHYGQGVHLKFIMSESKPENNEIVIYERAPGILGRYGIIGILHYAEETQLIMREPRSEIDMKVRGVEGNSILVNSYTTIVGGRSELKSNRLLRRQRTEAISRQGTEETIEVVPEAIQELTFNLNFCTNDVCLAKYFERNPFVWSSLSQQTDLPITTISSPSEIFLKFDGDFTG